MLREKLNSRTNQVLRQKQACAVEQEKTEIERILTNLPEIVGKASNQGLYSSEIYSFSDYSHWWYNRPNKPDHRWRGMLAIKEKAESEGLKAEIKARSRAIIDYGLYEYTLVIFWD